MSDDIETIEILGKVLPIGEAMDVVMKNVQSVLNDTHMKTREIIYLPDTVEESFRKSHILANDVQDMVDQLKILLGELKKVMTKIPFKAESTEEKEWVKSYNTDRKNKRKDITVELK